MKGTKKVLKIDIEKLHESLSFSNSDGSPEPVKKSSEPVVTPEEEKMLEEMT